MCQHCGCKDFIKAGKEAVIKRAVDIVQELQLNPRNVDDYECTEAISGLIAPFASRQDDVYQTASWISGLHQGLPQSGRDERYEAHVRAFQDIFSRLPVPGDPKQIATTCHQLEQLARELDEEGMASLAPETREVIRAVHHVHEESTRQERLKERYGL
ncbi:MAG: hypothetical protein HY697_02650 [Deltaproteobacteria bacterium]|nr:hypothetical protein [Deltaproteobacteria bacterium]